MGKRVIYMPGNNFRNMIVNYFGNMDLKARTVKSHVVILFQFAKRLLRRN